MFKKLSIIIPVYHEEHTIIPILEKIRSVDLIHGIEKEIIIVDDCSKDDSVPLIYSFIKMYPELQINLAIQKENSGKGACLHRGIKSVSGDLVIFQDADLEYDPLEYNILIAKMISTNSQVVYGSRFLRLQPESNSRFWYDIGNRSLTWFSNLVNNMSLTDMETCYKLFQTEVIKSIELRENRFGIEPEITAKISRLPHVQVAEVAISYQARTYEQGKKIGWKDGLRAIYCIIKYGMMKR